jgi:hypothetical protein
VCSVCFAQRTHAEHIRKIIAHILAGKEASAYRTTMVHDKQHMCLNSIQFNYYILMCFIKFKHFIPLQALLPVYTFLRISNCG